MKSHFSIQYYEAKVKCLSSLALINYLSKQSFKKIMLLILYLHSEVGHPFDLPKSGSLKK